MTDKPLKWIAFNEGDTPPPENAMVKVQLANQTRIHADEYKFEPASEYDWALLGDHENNIVAYCIKPAPRTRWLVEKIGFAPIFLTREDAEDWAKRHIYGPGRITQWQEIEE